MAARLMDDVFDALDEQTVVVPGIGTLDVVIPSLVRSLAAVHEQRRALEAQFDELLEAHPLSQVLTSLPGVGVRTAAVLPVTVGDGTSFPTAAHLASYVGLASATKQSGTSIHGKHAGMPREIPGRFWYGTRWQWRRRLRRAALPRPGQGEVSGAVGTGRRRHRAWHLPYDWRCICGAQPLASPPGSHTRGQGACGVHPASAPDEQLGPLSSRHTPHSPLAIARRIFISSTSVLLIPSNRIRSHCAGDPCGKLQETCAFGKSLSIQGRHQRAQGSSSL